MTIEPFDTVEEALTHATISVKADDGGLGERNLTDGLYTIARGLGDVAYAIERLGLNDAHTNLGAIELLAREIRAFREEGQ